MNELIGWDMLGTLAGLSLATVIITSVIVDAFGAQKRWFALVVAVVLSVLGAVFNVDLTNVENPAAAWASLLLLALINSFVVYTSATGINTIWVSGKHAELPIIDSYGGGGDGEATEDQQVTYTTPRTAARWW